MCYFCYMKISKSQRNNIIFLVLIAILLIPQTRKPIQVFLNKGLALFSPSIVNEDKREVVSDFNWNLQNTNTLETYNFKNAEGKVVLINFWATWCPPCIAELPSLDQLYQSYNDKVVFLFVSNEEIAVVNKFLAKKGMSLPVYKPISNYPEVFDVTSIPRTFLIDKQGNIVIDKTGAANWNSDKVQATIDELLN